MKARRHQERPVRAVASRLIAFLALALLAVSAAFAQFDTAVLNGNVRDSSGAIVPGANVKIRNLDTGLVRSTTSNASGIYNLTEIPPGTYDVSVSASGFETTDLPSVTLSVSQNRTLNIALTVGSVSQTVTVNAANIGVDTSSATVGVALDTQSVNALPLNGRNYTGLFLLQPGVTPINDAQTGGRTNPVGNAVYPSIQGQNNRSNSFLLDGVNNNEAISGSQTITVIPDDIQEVKVLSHNDYAQFGGSVGGIINVITKSGTNQLHGAAWEYYRDANLFDARNPITGLLNPVLQNQFGADLGGPVIIPRLYNGRNKTFFFASYEGFKHKQSAESPILVPTAQELSGDLSALSTTQIYNPFTATRDPFPGNIIPAQYLDQNAIKFAQMVYPKVGTSQVVGYNATDTTPETQNSDQYDLRVDEYLSQKDQVWSHYLHQHDPIAQTGGFPGLLHVTGYSGYNFGVAWVHTFSSSSVLTSSFGRNQGVQNPTVQFVAGNVPSILNATGFAAGFACNFKNSFRSCMLPDLNFSPYVNGGENNGAPNVNSDVYEYKVDYSHTIGHHTIYAGFNIDTNNQGKAASAAPNETFSSFETSSSTAQGGSPLASFLLGVPDSAQRSDTLQLESGGYVNGLYGQDQWKVRDNLTLNFGLRYDITSIPKISNSPYGAYYGILDFYNGTYIMQNLPPACSPTQFAPCIPGGTLPANVFVAKDHILFHSDHTNIEPRVGVSYRVRPDLVIRGSYGRIYDNWAAIDQYGQNVQSWPLQTYAIAQNLNPGVPAVDLENPLADFTGNYPPPTPFNQVGWNGGPQYRAPYSDQYTFGIQQEVTGVGVATINYVGSRQRKLDYTPVANTAQTPGPGPVNLRSPFPYITPSYFDQPIGRGSYNALQASLQGRNSRSGFTYLLSYTWSKSIDIGTDGWFGEGASSIQNPYNMNADRSVTGYDLTNVLSLGWTWDVPVGKNRFSTGNKIADYAIGNWQVNGILYLTSGIPFTVTDSGDIANTGNFGNYERPNLIGNPGVAHKTINQQFNAAAFATPAIYTFGDVGRNSLRADPYRNLDLSIFRQFPLYERFTSEFRLDAFNALNHVSYGTPNSTQNAPNFGTVTTTRSTERELQVSVKLLF